AFKNFQDTDCEEYLAKYDSFSTKEYLIKVGGLSRGAVDMIGDLLNEDSGFYLSFLASLWDFDVFSNETQITGGFDPLPERPCPQKGLPRRVIRFNCTRGDQSMEQRGTEVRVFTRRTADTLAPRPVRADYVLSTSTAMPTRAHQFLPAPVRAKSHALRSSHYPAGGSKIVLACSERFWEKDGIRGGPLRHLDRPLAASI
ncbi:LOW QUALITY PROTEIN: L-amino acid oxidase Lm29-like, partial [Manacus vitellinus]|uniref:LOW QUALITY PROTEIN: L-amino acid oxidase Lm29-like n=1 Tax=Manacus vitellinus TaxID=328815 RepID=UPI00115E138A